MRKYNLTVLSLLQVLSLSIHGDQKLLYAEAGIHMLTQLLLTLRGQRHGVNPLFGAAAGGMLIDKRKLIYENDLIMFMIERMDHIFEPQMEKAEQHVQMIGQAGFEKRLLRRN